VSGPENAFIYPKKPSLIDEGFDEAFDMPDGEAGDGGDALICNPGLLAKHIGFGEDGV
jgi:hypothetical protein